MKLKLLTLIFIFSLTEPYRSSGQCTCDLVLHDRSIGDGLQALDFSNMPDSTSALFISNDTTGWLELLEPYHQVVDTSGAVKAGVSVCLRKIERRVYLENIQGDSLSPIVIKNYPGEVSEIYNESTYAGLQIHDSKYFEVRGDCNVVDSVRGIYIHGINSNGVEVSGLSEEFSIFRVKVDTAGSGVKVKDNRDAYFANCQPAGVNQPTDSTWFASNITIEECILSNLTNEGIYMNNTSYKFDYQCDVNKMYHGYEMDGVYILNNQIINTGKDGVQATGVVRNCIIDGNQILNVGTDGYSAHGNGVHFGEGSAGRVTNNWIEKTSGVGVFVAGLGVIDVSQNVVLQTSGDAISGHAGTVMCSGSCKYSRDPSFFGLTNYHDLEKLRIFNNTIAFTNGIGVNVNAPVENVKMSKVYVNNNIITEWDEQALDFVSSKTANYDGFTHAGNNFITSDISDVHFVNGVANTSGNYGPEGVSDYKLTNSSGACDFGVGLNWMDSVWSSLDYEGNSREQQLRRDCGAYESNFSMPDSTLYLSTASCDCALTKEIYGFDGEGVGAGYQICLLDSARDGRIWFQNLEGSVNQPVTIEAVEEMTIAMSYNSNAIAFKDCAHFNLEGEIIHISANNSNYANVDFTSGNTGNVRISNLEIIGSDDLIDVAHGYGTNLLDSLWISQVLLQSTAAGSNLIRIKGHPTQVILSNVQATSSSLNQTLLEVNLSAGGDLGIYNSIFDGFDTDQTMHKWIQLSMQVVDGSYEANSVKLMNNSLVNLANSNTNSTSNFRILHKSGTGSIDTMVFANNVINKSAIENSLSASNYKNSYNQVSIFTANYELIEYNYSTEEYDSLYLDDAYIPEENSPLVDAGQDYAGSLVRWVDHYYNNRPDTTNQLVDIGACELSITGGPSARRASNSIETFANELVINVYPNPTNNIFTISNLEEGSRIIVYDENGRMVYYNENAETDLLKVDTRLWTNGVYHLNISGTQIFQSHVLVKH